MLQLKLLMKMLLYNNRNRLSTLISLFKMSYVYQTSAPTILLSKQHLQRKVMLCHTLRNIKKEFFRPDCIKKILKIKIDTLLYVP